MFTLDFKILWIATVPKQDVNVNSSGMHKVGVCKHHQNIKFLTLSLPLKFNYKDILEKVVWYKLKKLHAACMWKLSWIRCCKKFYFQLFQWKQHQNSTNTDKEITCMLWISTDRTTMNKLTSSVDEYIALLANKVISPCEHFIAKAQPDYLQTQKKNLQQDEAIILLDFAEKY